MTVIILFKNTTKKSFTVSTEILISTTQFSINNNNKCFLSSKSSY